MSAAVDLPRLRRWWVWYAPATLAAALIVLAIFVGAYDDNGLTDHLRGLGGFTRRTMRVLSFPLGWPVGAMVSERLSLMFQCAEPDGPCSVFVDWWTHFTALVAQILLLRWLLRQGAANTQAHS